MSDRNEEFPFTTPEGSDASMFIQWKGTKVCMDFHCPCGVDGHVDDWFAYYIHCTGCGTVYEMGTQVIAKRTTKTGPDDPAVKPIYSDEPMAYLSGRPGPQKYRLPEGHESPPRLVYLQKSVEAGGYLTDDQGVFGTMYVLQTSENGNPRTLPDGSIIYHHVPPEEEPNYRDEERP